MTEKRRDIFISNKPEPDADDSGFWEWLDEEDAKEYERLRKEGKMLVDGEN
jgi:hypothetical protein